jgi:hypothetical protein
MKTSSVTTPEYREHLVELGELLALGLIRLRARQSSGTSADGGESSLDCVGGQSGHAGPVPGKDVPA